MLYNGLSMEEIMHRTAACRVFVAALLVAITGNAQMLQAEEQSSRHYRETLAVIQMLYGIEVRAAHRFQLFSERAKAEGHGNIAHLFRAISISESIHATHFKELIEALGDKTAAIDLSSIKAASTDENLKYASTSELAEINNQYPRYIARITPEGHAQAIEYVHFAWQAEKHHRKLIEQKKSRTARLYNKLLATFGADQSRYYVNQNCGATVTELPKSDCPVCHFPLDTYTEVARP